MTSWMCVDRRACGAGRRTRAERRLGTAWRAPGGAPGRYGCLCASPCRSASQPLGGGQEGAAIARKPRPAVGAKPQAEAVVGTD